MARFADPISRLIDELRKLPGIGAKSAQRMAFHLLRGTDDDARALADSILVLREKLRLCSICNNITDVDPCVYCASPARDQHTVCVIEEPTNIATIEKTRSYNGVYHVLHGTLSPIGGVGPEQLRISSLLTRLAPSAPTGRKQQFGNSARRRDQLSSLCDQYSTAPSTRSSSPHPPPPRAKPPPPTSPPRSAASTPPSTSPASPPESPPAPTSSTPTRSPSPAPSKAAATSKKPLHKSPF